MRKAFVIAVVVLLLPSAGGAFPSKGVPYGGGGSDAGGGVACVADPAHCLALLD